MKANETSRNAKHAEIPFEKVFDRQRRRVRGIWLRGLVYYAQMDVLGQTKRIPLPTADSIATALSARQDLKNKIAAGQYPPKKVAQEVAQSAKPVDHTLGAAIKGYQTTRDTLHQVDEDTARREDSCLTLWAHYAGAKDVSEVDSALLLAHAQARSKTATELRKERLRDELEELLATEGLSEEELEKRVKWRKAKLAEDAKAKEVSGRAKDLDVLTLSKVLDWAVIHKFIQTKPDLTWTKLAKPPKKVRLMTQEQLDEFANANMAPGNVDDQPEKVRHLWAHQAARGQAFRDFIYAIWYSGAREHETTLQRWENVTWSTPGNNGRIFFLGANAKAGAGKPAEDRNVDFNPKLEAHLKEMFERRDKNSPWMFPSSWDPTKHMGSFGKQLRNARKVTGQKDVGFHHGRHFFISHAVAAGVDYKQIAIWVSHRDGGFLIGRKYSHMVPGHGQTSALKITF